MPAFFTNAVQTFTTGSVGYDIGTGDSLLVGPDAVLAHLADNTVVVLRDGARLRLLGDLFSESVGVSASSNTVVGVASGASVTGGFFGVVTRPDSVNARIANAGEIQASTGIAFDGNGTLTNTGSVVGADYGVTTFSSGFAQTFIENSGTISGRLAMIARGTTTIANSGSITGAQQGIVASGLDATERLVLHNSGLLQSPNSLVVIGGPGDDGITNTGQIAGNMTLGAGSDTVTNTGQIAGRVTLDDGDDRYDGRLGTITGIVDGGLGSDTILGGSGNETIVGGTGADSLEGGGGIDTLRYLGSTEGVAVSLRTGRAQGGTAAGDSIAGFENLEGGNESDLLIGDRYANELVGSGGDDRLDGLGGDDTISGGSGDDTILGGIGTDRLSGGSGNDTFRYERTRDSRADRSDLIVDFGPGDRIDLTGIDANTASALDDAFLFLGAFRFSGTAGELSAFVERGVTVVQGDVDGDARADFRIELLGTPSVTADSFLL